MLEEIFKNPKERTDFIISMVVVSLFIGAIVYGSIGNLDIEDMSEATFVSIDHAPSVEEVEEITAVEVLQDDRQVRSERRTRDAPEIESWTPAVVSVDADAKATTTDNTINDEVIIPSMEKDVEIAEEEVATQPEVEQEESDVMPTVPETDVKEVVEQAVVEPIVESESSEPSTEVETPIVPSSVRETGDCQIVVGAYSTEKNRQKMLNKLLEANFVTYTYKQRGLYVASVKVSCKESNKKEALAELKKNFARGAFIPKK